MSEEKKEEGVVINALDEGLEMNKGHEANNIWVAIAINQDGDEGIVAIGKNGVVMPLLCSEFNNLSAITEMARKVLRSDGGKGKRIVIRHFSNPVDIEEVTA